MSPPRADLTVLGRRGAARPSGDPNPDTKEGGPLGLLLPRRALHPGASPAPLRGCPPYKTSRAAGRPHSSRRLPQPLGPGIKLPRSPDTSASPPHTRGAVKPAGPPSLDSARTRTQINTPRAPGTTAAARTAAPACARARMRKRARPEPRERAALTRAGPRRRSAPCGARCPAPPRPLAPGARGHLESGLPQVCSISTSWGGRAATRLSWRSCKARGCGTVPSEGEAGFWAVPSPGGGAATAEAPEATSLSPRVRTRLRVCPQDQTCPK